VVRVLEESESGWMVPGTGRPVAPGCADGDAVGSRAEEVMATGELPPGMELSLSLGPDPSSARMAAASTRQQATASLTTDRRLPAWP
jgi:hypothetical protein